MRMEAESEAGKTPAGHRAEASITALPPFERAFALYCRGMRSGAIAAHIGVPARTVRRWLRLAQRRLAEEARERREGELRRAVECQRAVMFAAWEAYERECALEQALLDGRYDRVRRRAIRPAADGAAEAVREEYERPYRLNQGSRYLAVIVAAQREIARLEGLYELARAEGPRDISITITRRPDGPENIPPGATSSYEVIDGGPGEDDEDDEGYDAGWSPPTSPPQSGHLGHAQSAFRGSPGPSGGL